MKTCCDCKEEKELSEFPSAGNGRLRPRCKPCYNIKQKENREENPEQIRKSWKKASGKYYTTDRRRNKTLRSYGLTEETYNKMYDSQGGLCKICDRELPLVVDHCHSTHVIRGLLCNMCNVGLGCFQDDVDRMKRAIEYLDAG